MISEQLIGLADSLNALGWDACAAQCREAAAQLDALTAERDALKLHYDAAGPEHNLLALLDLYWEREQAAKAELARCHDRLAGLEAERDERDKHTTARIRELEDAVNVLYDEKQTALQQCAKVAGLVELWTKRCGEWRANSQLHSPDIAVARAYEIAASELGMALATAAAASPERGTGGEAKCQRCAGTGRLDGGWVRCDDCRGTGNALANATTGAVKP
jgi:hypothetical protein